MNKNNNVIYQLEHLSIAEQLQPAACLYTYIPLLPENGRKGSEGEEKEVKGWEREEKIMKVRTKREGRKGSERAMTTDRNEGNMKQEKGKGRKGKEIHHDQQFSILSFVRPGPGRKTAERPTKTAVFNHIYKLGVLYPHLPRSGPNSIMTVTLGVYMYHAKFHPYRYIYHRPFGQTP